MNARFVAIVDVQGYWDVFVRPLVLCYVWWGRDSVSKPGRSVESQTDSILAPLWLYSCLWQRRKDHQKIYMNLKRQNSRLQLNQEIFGGRLVGQRRRHLWVLPVQGSEAVCADWTSGTTFPYSRPVVETPSGSQVAFRLRRRRLCTSSRSHREKTFDDQQVGRPKVHCANSLPIHDCKAQSEKAQQQDEWRVTIFMVLEGCYESERQALLLLCNFVMRERTTRLAGRKPQAARKDQNLEVTTLNQRTRPSGETELRHGASDEERIHSHRIRTKQRGNQVRNELVR